MLLWGFLLTGARLLLSLWMEKFHPIYRWNVVSSGISHLLLRKAGLMITWPAFIYIANHLGHRCHNNSFFGNFFIHPSLSNPLLSSCLLWGITFQHDVPDSHHPRDLFDLSPYQLQVGFRHRGRIMRRWDEAQSVHRHLQLPTRRHCGSVTYAHTVGSANGSE